MHTGSPRHGGAPAAEDEPDEPHGRPRPLAGVVLCGGESRRMGTDKAALLIDGERLVERVARRLATVADPVVLASGEPGRLEDVAWPQLGDAAPGVGPLGGLVAALEASPHALVAVVAVDLPMVSGALLRALAEWWDGEDALVPVDEEGRRQPLHAVYARRIAPHLRRALAAGDFAIGRALSGLDVGVVPPATWRTVAAPGWATNVNTPDDLRRLHPRRASASEE